MEENKAEFSHISGCLEFSGGTSKGITFNRYNGFLIEFDLADGLTARLEANSLDPKKVRLEIVDALDAELDIHDLARLRKAIDMVLDCVGGPKL